MDIDIEQSISMPSIETIYEDLKQAGLWWIIAPVIGLFLGPVTSVFIYMFILSIISQAAYVTITFFGVVFLMLSMIGSILMIVTFLYTMRLFYLDRSLRTGSLLGIVAKVLLFISFLFLIIGGFFVFLAFLISLAGFIVDIISSVYLIFGFYRIGDKGDNILIKLGSIFLIITYLIGGVLIGLGLRRIGEEIFTLKFRKLDWDKIREDVNKKLDEGETIYIPHYAIIKAINPLLLHLKFREWMIKEELKGYVFRNMVIPETL